MDLAVLAMWMPGGPEWIVILVVALLIFGRRLPDVARSVGKSIVEFKKGIRDVKEDINVRSQLEPPANSKLEHKPETSSEPAAAANSSNESTPASK